MTTPYLARDPYPWGALVRLIQRAFAGMEGRIDPPSSANRLTAAALAAAYEVWVVGQPPIACMVLTPQPGAMRVGKLAVDPVHRGQGLAQRLIATAAERARAAGLPALELQVRIELVENHAAFLAMGFRQTGTTTHQGYDRPTSLVFTLPL